MQSQLAEVLVQKGIINNNTNVETWYEGRGLGGIQSQRFRDFFNVISVEKYDETVSFVVLRNDGLQTRVSSNDIVSIDGMEPSSLAKAYDLNDDGTPRKIGKKRGRKPKNVRREE